MQTDSVVSHAVPKEIGKMLFCNLWLRSQSRSEFPRKCLAGLKWITKMLRMHCDPSSSQPRCMDPNIIPVGNRSRFHDSLVWEMVLVYFALKTLARFVRKSTNRVGKARERERRTPLRLLKLEGGWKHEGGLKSWLLRWKLQQSLWYWRCRAEC